MHRKAPDWPLDRIVKGEVVEKQKRIIFIAGVGGDGPAQQHASALDNQLRIDCQSHLTSLVHVTIDAARAPFLRVSRANRHEPISMPASKAARGARLGTCMYSRSRWWALAPIAPK